MDNSFYFQIIIIVCKNINKKGLYAIGCNLSDYDVEYTRTIPARLDLHILFREIGGFLNMSKEITPAEFDYNVFNTIGKDWMLISASANGKTNAMTASWGGMGVMWGKNVAYIVIRPQRYTKEFIDASDELTISVFGEEKRKAMTYMGTVSGRDEDKIAKAGFAVFEADGQKFFGDAKTTMFCRKLYAQEMQENCFIDKSCDEKWYADKDYHTMYIVEIQKILVND